MNNAIITKIVQKVKFVTSKIDSSNKLKAAEYVNAQTALFGSKANVKVRVARCGDFSPIFGHFWGKLAIFFGYFLTHF